MKFADKEFSYYWQAIQWPTSILIVWSIAGLIVGLTAFDSYISIFGNRWLGFAPYLFFLIAGYLAASDHGATVKQSSWAGALSAAVSGLVGMIVFFIMLSASPLLEWTIQTAVSQSAAAGAAADPAMLEKVLPVTMSIGAVFGVVINAALGGLLGWIGFLLSKKL